MNDIAASSAFFGIALSLIAFRIGLFCKEKFRATIFNPLLIALILVIAFLKLTGTTYASYMISARPIGMMLTPATVCLAIPLYEQLSALRRSVAAVAVGVLSGVIANMICVVVFVLLVGLGRSELVTILPKSITTAIGIGLSEELGGIPAITSAVIAMTGLMGGVVGGKLCTVLHIDEPAAQGISIGASSHAIGTASAMQMGDLQGAMSSLSLVLSGLMTVVISPLVAELFA